MWPQGRTKHCVYTGERLRAACVLYDDRANRTRWFSVHRTARHHTPCQQHCCARIQHMACLMLCGALARAQTLLTVARGVRMRASPTAALTGGGQLRLEEPSAADLEVLEKRQLGHKASSILGCGMRCKHGFPQAFAFDPLTRAPWMVNGAELPRKSKLESGLFRLSCPMLVRAIDEWEGEGAVRAINDELREQPGDKSGCSGGGDLAAKLEAAHVGHAAARREIIGERLHLLLDEAAATGEEQTRIITTVLESGIAGQTRSKVDIKCVHAQLADHLCRSESNGLAAELVQRLEARGVDVRGNDECRTQCDMSVPESAARASWWYEPAKNKWKLRKRQHRRVQARVDKRAAEREGPAEERVAAGPGVRVSGLGGRPQGDAVVR